MKEWDWGNVEIVKTRPIKLEPDVARLVNLIDKMTEATKSAVEMSTHEVSPLMSVRVRHQINGKMVEEDSTLGEATEHSTCGSCMILMEPTRYIALLLQAQAAQTRKRTNRKRRKK